MAQGSLRLCLTGPTGRIGQAFMALAARLPGLRLRALRRPGSPLLPGPVEWIEGDLADPAACDRLLDGQDVLVHLAWSGVPLADQGYASGLSHGLLPSLHLMDAARRHGGLRIVYPSSGGTVYADRGDRRLHHEDDACLPTNPYGIQKLAAEHYLRVLSGTGRASARILRVATAYGWLSSADAQQGFIGIALRSALRGEPVRLVGDPENVRDFVHRDDIAEALLKAALKPIEPGETEVVNIGSGVGTSVRQVVALIEQELGRPVATRQEHWDAARGLPGHAVLDISRARELLGWSPRIALSDGIRMGLRGIQRAAAA
jgi:UDP-glucose 4-epimerase